MFTFIVFLLCLWLIFSVLLVGQQLLLFKCGLFFLGGAIFYSFGAYSSAILNIKFHTPPVLSILVSILLSGFLSFCIGYPLIKKLKQDYFALVSLAISLVFFVIYRSFAPGGNSGLAGIESLNSFFTSINISSKISDLLFVLLFALLAFWSISKIYKTRLGLLFNASRMDENKLQVLGFSPFKIKMQAFIISGLLGGAAGALQAHFIGAIDPGLSSLSQTILILSGTILSGRKTIWGCFIGSFFIIIVPEIIQRLLSIQFETLLHIFPAIQILYGLLIIIIAFSMFPYTRTFLRVDLLK